jgi:hypothetical protein
MICNSKQPKNMVTHAEWEETEYILTCAQRLLVTETSVSGLCVELHKDYHTVLSVFGVDGEKTITFPGIIAESFFPLLLGHIVQHRTRKVAYWDPSLMDRLSSFDWLITTEHELLILEGKLEGQKFISKISRRLDYDPEWVELRPILTA